MQPAALLVTSARQSIALSEVQASDTTSLGCVLPSKMMLVCPPAKYEQSQLQGRHSVASKLPSASQDDLPELQIASSRTH